MAVDVAQCGSSRIKSYASAFSNILMSDFLRTGKRTPQIRIYTKIGNDMPTLVKINNNQRVMDPFNGLDLGHIGSSQG